MKREENFEEFCKQLNLTHKESPKLTLEEELKYLEKQLHWYNSATGRLSAEREYAHIAKRLLEICRELLSKR